MSGFIKSLFIPSDMCENCGVQPKFTGFRYCGKTCAAAVGQNMRAAFEVTTLRSPPPDPVNRQTSTPHRSSSEAPNTSASNTCHTCGIQPKFPGFDYCGQTCAAEAGSKKKVITETANAQGTPNSIAGQGSPSYQSAEQQEFNTPAKAEDGEASLQTGTAQDTSAVDWAADDMEDELPPIDSLHAKFGTPGQATPVSNVASADVTQVAAAPTPPAVDSAESAPEQQQSEELAGGLNAPAQAPKASDDDEWITPRPPKPSARGGRGDWRGGEISSSLCEHCFTRPKSREADDDGTVITHSHCGIRCYKASQGALFPASTIPAPAAAFGGQEPLKLCAERVNAPVGRKILLMIRQRWQSETVRTPQVKGLYRIDFPKEVYRRFDVALQMNDDCAVKTTYYGGPATCSITDDTDPAPCESEFCELCDALRHSFSNLLQGPSCRDGRFGPGLYTYLNPALAHDSMVSEDPQAHKVNYAIIQCRVVTQADNMPNSNSYTGLIDDSGVVFCAQSTAVIPTHVLIYNLSASPNSRQLSTAVNSNSAVTDRATPTIPARSSGFGQGNRVATSPSASRGLPAGPPLPLSPSSVPAPPHLRAGAATDRSLMTRSNDLNSWVGEEDDLYS